jgi:hypothetical protein
MKLQKFFLVSTVLFVSLQICFGQAKPKAMLIDEFGRISCEELKARTDGFYQKDLGSNPDSIGYILINGNKNKSLEKYMLEIYFKSAILSHKYDINRVVFIRGKDNNSTNGKFWVVTSGADKPVFDEEDWDYALPGISKAIKFHERIWETFDDICPSNRNFSEELYAKLLLGNPDFRGNIVISRNSSTSFQKNRKEIINELVNKYKIPINRLRFFNDKNGYPDNVEYWLVPIKKK